MKSLKEYTSSFQKESQNQGIILFLISLGFAACIDLAGKLVVNYAEPAFTNVFRYALLTFYCYIAYKREEKYRSHVFTRSDKLLLLFRGLLQGSMGFSYLLALQYLPLSLASSIYFAAPLFIVFLSVPFLQESITLKQVVAASLGFCGILIILRPSLEIDMRGLTLMLISMTSYIFLQIFTRKLAARVSAYTQVFYGNIGAFLLALCAVPTITELPHNLPMFLLLLFIMGTCAFFSQVFSVKAFTATKAAVLAPFNYLQLVFVLCISYLFLDEQLDMISLLGISIIIVSGILSGRK